MTMPAFARTRERRLLIGGAAAGGTAALAVTLVMVVLRDAFGLASAPELVGDRIAALLPVQFFLGLLSLVGGYNNLKALGVVGVLLGGLAAGGVAGLAYARIAERQHARVPLQMQPLGISWRAATTVTGLALLFWLLSVAALWFVLPTNFHGLPPGPARWSSALTLLGLCLGYVPLLLLAYRILVHHEPDKEVLSQPAVLPVVRDEGVTPRRGLVPGGAAAALTVATGLQLRRVHSRAAFHYDGTEYRGADVQAITPNDRFYSVTKNIVDPTVKEGLWRLEITGNAARPRSYTLGDVRDLPPVTQETTLMCISNRVGGGLMSNALWKGVPLARLLEAAGAGSGVKEVVLRSVDGYTDTISIEKAMDPATLVAFEMNGEPLPRRHGFPARMIVPGYFGEKSVKWVTRVELVDTEKKGFYEQQGWGPSFIVPTRSRFDLPDPKTALRAGAPTLLKGIAFGGDRGVSRVEVSTDGGGSWQPARLDYPGTRLTWALWSLEWRPPAAGTYRLAVRAVDGGGAPQVAEERDTAPQGATGYHRITTQVTA